jgi:formylglycine-generating enzyme required for sulfatase activity
MPRISYRALLPFWFVTFGCEYSVPPDTDSAPPAEMQLVDGASFTTGTNANDLEKIREATGLTSVRPLLPEVPSHQVTVNSFYIDTTDVTNEQFAEFVAIVPEWGKTEVDPSVHNGRYLEHWTDDAPPLAFLDHPVTFVTWQSAVAYCNWRDKRLPTEIEFEWAAQDGLSSVEYPWGNSPPDNRLVSWSGTGAGTTVPVASYPPNVRGLFDMSGNIWHFTADPWLGSHEEAMSKLADDAIRATDPTIRRVVKGGSWGANAANLRVRYRDSHRPYDAREMVGFRCARSADAD